MVKYTPQKLVQKFIDGFKINKINISEKDKHIFSNQSVKVLNGQLKIKGKDSIQLTGVKARSLMIRILEACHFNLNNKKVSERVDFVLEEIFIDETEYVVALEED